MRKLLRYIFSTTESTETASLYIGRNVDMRCISTFLPCYDVVIFSKRLTSKIFFSRKLSSIEKLLRVSTFDNRKRARIT